MIKNIVFDLGGVLVPLNREACNRAFSKIGFKDFNSILNNYVQEGFFLQYEKGAISSEKFRSIVREYMLPPFNQNVKDSEIDNALESFLDDIPLERFELLLSLRKNYKLYMLSNTNPIAISYVEKLFLKRGKKMEECFDRVFLSYQMKMTKPNRDIFTSMIDQAKMNPSETLFIDDSPANIEAAAKVGLKTLLYSPDCNLVREVEAAL